MIHPRADYNNGRFVDTEGRIPEDEPVFLLRGQDELTTMMMRLYVSEYRRRYGDGKVPQTIEAFIPKVLAWPKKKQADMPE